MRPSNTYWRTEPAQPLFVSNAARSVGIVTGANRGICVWGPVLPDGGPTGGFFRDGRPAAW